MPVRLHEADPATSQARRSIAAKLLVRVLIVSLFTTLGIDSARATIPHGERVVLDAIYTQAGGSAWFSTTSQPSTAWESSADECTWFGITCDAGGNHVIDVELGDDNLSGTLPDISGLTELQSIDVFTGTLSGPLPALASLTSLQNFNALGNRFTGSIPSLSGLTALQTFEVSGNLLTGSVPDLSSLTVLSEFDVAFNKLTGPVPNPPFADTLMNGGGASLCPNFFDPPSTPQSATDLFWDAAVDSESWYEGCSAALVVTAAVPAPALDRWALLTFIFAICGLVRRQRSLR